MTANSLAPTVSFHPWGNGCITYIPFSITSTALPLDLICIQREEIRPSLCNSRTPSFIWREISFSLILPSSSSTERIGFLMILSLTDSNNSSWITTKSRARNVWSSSTTFALFFLRHCKQFQKAEMNYIGVVATSSWRLRRRFISKNTTFARFKLVS